MKCFHFNNFVFLYKNFLFNCLLKLKDILNNFFLEKNYLKKQIQDYFPGLKPSSSWPMCLDDLIEKLSTLEIGHMFHQPFDVTKNMHNETIEFIRHYYNCLEKELLEDVKDENSLILYKEYLEKAIQVFITVKIHEGSFSNFLEMLNFLKEISDNSHKSENCKNYFTEIFSNSLTKCNEVFLKLSQYILSLKETLPIMRNYNINDIFYISKNILFTSNNRNCGPGQSIISLTTDSTYLYIILSGVSGCMLKVGTGNNSTEKGKVYCCKQFEFEDSVTWVLCKNKLYLKRSSNEIGLLEIYNIENFKNEGKIKLMINETGTSDILKKKNRFEIVFLLTLIRINSA